jgi:hypothetical protein
MKEIAKRGQDRMLSKEQIKKYIQYGITSGNSNRVKSKRKKFFKNQHRVYKENGKEAVYDSIIKSLRKR